MEEDDSSDDVTLLEMASDNVVPSTSTTQDQNSSTPATQASHNAPDDTTHPVQMITSNSEDHGNDDVDEGFAEDINMHDTGTDILYEFDY